MPRQSHGRPVMQASDTRHTQKLKRTRGREGRRRGRGLDALQIAEREVSVELGARMKERLGLDADEENEASDAEERPWKRTKKSGDDNGSQDDDNSDQDSEKWHVMGEGPEGDEEDEDSEIESEDAFGSSDDDKFDGWRFSGSQGGRKAGSKRQDAEGEDDDDDDYDNDDESLGEEAVDLATAWDMDDQEQLEERNRQERKKVKQQTPADMDPAGSTSEEDEVSEDSDDDNDIESDLSVSDAEDGDHARLQNFVQSLSHKPDTSKISSEGSKQTTISASELLQYVNDPTQRQSLKILQSTERKGPEEYKGGIPGRLAAPLPKRQQDRLDRSAAYEQSKKELGRWVETVKQDRRAEHLQFPLVDPNDPVAHPSRQLPEIQGKPMTDLERRVQEIMVETGMMNEDDDAEREEDELIEQKVSLEEIQARRAEMRRQRDLLFREEVKARRIKKIKSKAYRRIHRKERAKLEAEKRAEDVMRGEVDSDEERERQERVRAEERMGRRHRESKWAKGAKEIGKGKWDTGARAAIEDMARRDDELRRRVEGRAKDDSMASDDSSSDNDSDDEGEALEEELLHLDRQANDGTKSKLGSMAFMQRAEATAKARNEAEIQEIRRQLTGKDGDLDSETEAAQPVGRQKFGITEESSTNPPKESRRTSEFEERLSDEDLSNDEDKECEPTNQASKPSSGIDNPPKPVSMALATLTKLPAQANGAQQPKAKSLKPRRQHETTLDDYTSPSESEPDNEAVESGNAEALTLADDIFAGDDDVIKEFQKEKEEVVLEEGDQIVDNALPGWGSWTGAGISKKSQKRAKNKTLVTTTTKGVSPEKRQDAKLEKVIINEKRVKKNGKYLATELPHPFESRQQYERSLRLPLGPEWTTKSTFQEATKPRVLVKQGIIRAIQRPKV